MSTKPSVWSVSLLAGVLLAGWSTGLCQENKAPSVKTVQDDLSINAYRLDFSINELDAGKKINSREYSMNLSSNEGDAIKVGTRVPVQAEQGKFQYIDVGTEIWTMIKEHANGLALRVRADISSFAVPDQANHAGEEPVLRQLSIHGSTLAPLGKLVAIGSVDDPNSKHQFQLTVLVTKLTQ